ncbi:MAG: hypothetical protein MZU91_01455 [Desulfosudis oleivorans]|nr:hypothetical protein [Desulfosudis oleivorans]
MYQGKRAETYERNLNFRYDPRSCGCGPAFARAHIDHSGNLPNLVKQGYEGTIYATRATAELGGLMIRDSGRIQESDAEFVNKKRARTRRRIPSSRYTQNGTPKKVLKKVVGVFVLTLAIRN